MANFKLTAVREGQQATFETVGDGRGWIRRAAPSDGLVIETDETTVFLPRDTIMAALAEIPARKVRR